MVLKNLYTKVTSKIFPIIFGGNRVEKTDEKNIRKFTKHVFKKYDKVIIRLSYE